MLWEKVLDVIVSIMLVIKLVWFIDSIVWSVAISSIGVPIHVNDCISRVVLELGFFIVITVTIGQFIRIL